ncbi:MAG: hypothetical protein AB7O65_14305, partial [Candidatus Korobacteraceae bacterium]
NHHLPPAFRGIAIAGFLAAFMSTVATQLNWGASYLVSDFYRRFLKADASEAHYVRASRVATVVLVVAAAFVSAQLATIRGGWEFVLEVGAGTGGVYLLRWYWWRINAWSEISAMISALVMAAALRWVAPFSGEGAVMFAKSALATTAVTTVVWIAVTLLTPPEREEVLVRFYRQVRPDVRGWKPIAALAGAGPHHRDLGPNLAAFALGTLMVYLALFGTGKLVLRQPLPGAVMLTASAVCALLLYWNQSRRNWEDTGVSAKEGKSNDLRGKQERSAATPRA